MSLHWYACISTNTYCFGMYHISLETDWWALPNTSLIVRIRSAFHEILADKAFVVTDVLISQSFVVTFVHPIYVHIALIWGFLVQLGLWKSVHLLWRYKLNEVCDNAISWIFLSNKDLFVLLTIPLNFFQSELNLDERYMFRFLLHSLFYQALECLVILTHLEYLFQRFSKKVTNSCTIFSSILLSRI